MSVGVCRVIRVMASVACFYGAGSVRTAPEVMPQFPNDLSRQDTCQTLLSRPGNSYVKLS